MNNDFLDNMYQSQMRPLIEGAQALETWIVDGNHYPTYKKFLKLFKEYDQTHKDTGNGVLHYKQDMSYPIDIDGTLDFHRFIKACIADSNLPITVKEFQKAWGVNYENGDYSGFHSHTPGKQLTAVLFLTDAEQNKEYPLAGSLVCLQPLEYEINSVTFTPKAGDCVIMDGKVYHGTYPAISNRKVFVCDFEYEISTWI